MSLPNSETTWLDRNLCVIFFKILLKGNNAKRNINVTSGVLLCYILQKTKTL